MVFDHGRQVDGARQRSDNHADLSTRHYRRNAQGEKRHHRVARSHRLTVVSNALVQYPRTQSRCRVRYLYLSLTCRIPPLDLIKRVSQGWLEPNRTGTTEHSNRLDDATTHPNESESRRVSRKIRCVALTGTENALGCGAISYGRVSDLDGQVPSGRCPNGAHVGGRSLGRHNQTYSRTTPLSGDSIYRVTEACWFQRKARPLLDDESDRSVVGTRVAVATLHEINQSG